MPLNKNNIIQAIQTEINKLSDQKLENTPTQLQDYAEGLVLWLRSSSFIHASGTVKATAPPSGGPVTSITAEGGTFVPGPLDTFSKVIRRNLEGPDSMIEELMKTESYFKANASIDFSSGKILGTSTALPGPPPVPGLLTNAGGQSGRLTGLSGEAWAKAVIPETADINYSKVLLQVILDTITSDIDLFYNTGSVTGAFAGPNAPLTAGTGAGGKIW